MEEVIPFGKHRGKPIEALLADKPYLDWLMQQNWFTVKYEKIINIIHSTAEATETPEHNEMQALFLDENITRSIIKTICNSSIIKITEEFTTRLAFEEKGFDIYFYTNLSYTGDYPYYGDYPYSGYIELKPCLGDDYPSVLREMKKRIMLIGSDRKCYSLIYKDLTTKSITHDQIKTIFKSSGIDVYRLNELVN